MENDAELTCDVLVIGSGAAGLATAVTAAVHGLKVIVVEKTPFIGGTSAWSGGWLWIPRNPVAKRAGINEPPEAPRTYLRNEIGAHADNARMEVFLENGPDMVSFFEENTEVKWLGGNVIPDFHTSEGAGKGGRSVTAAPYDGRKLGPLIKRLRPPLDIVSLRGMGLSAGADIGHFFNATRKISSALYVARRLGKHIRDLVLYGRSMQLVSGNALVARLLKSADLLGVAILTDAPAGKLVTVDGRVRGAEIGGGRRIIATKGVVLAAGGFPHDEARLKQLFLGTPGGSTHYSAAPRTNTGDGIRLGEAAGGALNTELPAPGAWSPVSLVPRKDGTTGHFPHLVERSKPGFIAVDPIGRRFVNEADSYHDFMAALFKVTPAGQQPTAWIIADHRAQRRFGLGWAKPFPFSLNEALRSGYLKRGRTLVELANACGLDARVFQETVETFNRNASMGKDPEFGRGLSPFNIIQGHGGVSLAPLTKAPFYAVQVVPGSLGTFAGLKTNARGGVLGAAGEPIPGLFAAGNDMDSIMAGHYPAGGITLGPAMTFGYVIGKTLAGEPIAGLNEKRMEKHDVL